MWTLNAFAIVRSERVQGRAARRLAFVVQRERNYTACDATLSLTMTPGCEPRGVKDMGRVISERPFPWSDDRPVGGLQSTVAKELS